MTKVIELPAAQYVAVTGYNDGVPIFGTKVWASDQVSAMTFFDLQDIFYVDVMLYVNTSQDRLYDDD